MTKRRLAVLTKWTVEISYVSELHLSLILILESVSASTSHVDSIASRQIIERLYYLTTSLSFRLVMRTLIRLLGSSSSSSTIDSIMKNNYLSTRYLVTKRIALQNSFFRYN